MLMGEFEKQPSGHCPLLVIFRGFVLLVSSLLGVSFRVGLVVLSNLGNRIWLTISTVRLPAQTEPTASHQKNKKTIEYNWPNANKTANRYSNQVQQE